jgi:hypothetical protein
VTSRDPMNPVPPMTTIFMLPPLLLLVKTRQHAEV